MDLYTRIRREGSRHEKLVKVSLPMLMRFVPYEYPCDGQKRHLGDNAAWTAAAPTPLGVDGGGRLRLRFRRVGSNGEGRSEEIH